MRTAICDQLGIEYPIFAFSHCRDVVAAVSRAGGFGVLGALGYTPEKLEEELAWIDGHVNDKPYGVDIVIPAKYVGRNEGDFSTEKLVAMVPEGHKEWMADLLEQHEVPPLPQEVEATDGVVGWSKKGGGEAVDIALRHPIKLLVNALGPPPLEVVQQAHDQGVLVAALVGRPDQALKQKEIGVDIIVAAGNEAGGHTGEIATMVLIPQVVDAVHPTPVLAAGGIGSGRQMAAGMALGAQGVWTGSIWLTVEEAAEFPVVTEKLLAARSNETVRSRCLTGKPVRQLKTAYTEAWDGPDSPGTLPMPLQMLATASSLQRIYRHAQTDHPTAGNLMGSPVGQIVGMMNSVRSTREVIHQMVSDYVDAIDRLNGLMDDL
jgi:NAD(P)H-dependent flavin oxidoreductase YrpB (nitropropane dioxygenase family)